MLSSLSLLLIVCGVVVDGCHHYPDLALMMVVAATHL